jgi:hypothetical protein
MRPRPRRRQLLTVAQILAWADSHFARTGRWPNREAGPIADDRNETWKAVDLALRRGRRGLDTHLSLAQLLDRERGVRNKQALPPLTEEQIAAWADEHRAHIGGWPNEGSGLIPGTRGEVWYNVDHALRVGLRGFPGGDSLPKLLARVLGVRNRTNLPGLTVEGILAWADAHRRRTDVWPNTRTGPVLDAPGEDWCRVDEALRLGQRGMSGGSSIAWLLTEHRGARPPQPTLTVEQILAWADAHQRRTGRWPGQESGPVTGAPDERWRTIDGALRSGGRGLPGGSSLARLLTERRGVRNRKRPGKLTIRMILDWADAHFARTDRWPSASAGPVQNAPGETWGAIDAALWLGLRGLPGSDSLARFLDRHRRAKRPGK